MLVWMRQGQPLEACAQDQVSGQTVWDFFYTPIDLLWMACLLCPQEDDGSQLQLPAISMRVPESGGGAQFEARVRLFGRILPAMTARHEPKSALASCCPYVLARRRVGFGLLLCEVPTGGHWAWRKEVRGPLTVVRSGPRPHPLPPALVAPVQPFSLSAFSARTQLTAAFRVQSPWLFRESAAASLPAWWRADTFRLRRQCVLAVGLFILRPY